MSRQQKEKFTPLFNTEGYEPKEFNEKDGMNPSGDMLPIEGSSVMSWTLPLIEKEDPTVKEEFKARIARLEREAYEKGFAQGQRDGLDLERKKLDEMGRQYEALLMELRDLKIQIFRESEGEMLKLIELIVKKVIGETVKTDDTVIRHCIKIATTFLTDKRKVRIIINPDDMEEVKKMLPDMARLSKGGHFQLAEDPSVGKGGCILETGFGKVNATIDDQVDEIIKVINKEYLMATRNKP